MVDSHYIIPGHEFFKLTVLAANYLEPVRGGVNPIFFSMLPVNTMAILAHLFAKGMPSTKCATASIWYRRLAVWNPLCGVGGEHAADRPAAALTDFYHHETEAAPLAAGANGPAPELIPDSARYIKDFTMTMLSDKQ